MSRSSDTARRRTGGAAAVVLAGVLAGVLTACGGHDPDGAPARPTGIAVGNGPCCIAESAGRMWVLNRRAETLQSIDPETLDVGEPVDVGARQMVVAGDKLFLADTHDGVLSIFDPRTERQTAIEGVAGRGAGVMRDGQLWVGSATSGELARVDLASGAVRQKVTVPDVSSYDSMVLADDGLLWTTTWEGELLQVDLDRRKVVSRHRPFPDAQDYVGIAAGDGGRLFAVSGGADELVVIDSTTGKVVDRRRIRISDGIGIPVLVPQPDGSLLLARAPDVVDVLDRASGEAEATFRLPRSTEPGVGDPFFGGAATGFGSLWVGVWNDLDTQGTVLRRPLD